MSASVSHILSGKGREVTTVATSASVHDAAKLLAARRIGALVVSDDGQRVSGIISERDIVRLLGQDGPDLNTPVSEVMTAVVHTCTEADTVDELMVQMTERRIRHVPVVDDEGHLAGMISIGDVVKSRTGELEVEAEALKGYVTGSNY